MRHCNYSRGGGSVAPPPPKKGRRGRGTTPPPNQNRKERAQKLHFFSLSSFSGRDNNFNLFFLSHSHSYTHSRTRILSRHPSFSLSLSLTLRIITYCCSRGSSCSSSSTSSHLPSGEKQSFLNLEEKKVFLEWFLFRTWVQNLFVVRLLLMGLPESSKCCHSGIWSLLITTIPAIFLFSTFSSKVVHHHLKIWHWFYLSELISLKFKVLDRSFLHSVPNRP